MYHFPTEMLKTLNLTGNIGKNWLISVLIWNEYKFRCMYIACIVIKSSLYQEKIEYQPNKAVTCF